MFSLLIHEVITLGSRCQLHHRFEDLPTTPWLLIKPIVFQDFPFDVPEFPKVSELD